MQHYRSMKRHTKIIVLLLCSGLSILWIIHNHAQPDVTPTAATASVQTITQPPPLYCPFLLAVLTTLEQSGHTPIQIDTLSQHNNTFVITGRCGTFSQLNQWLMNTSELQPHAFNIQNVMFKDQQFSLHATWQLLQQHCHPHDYKNTQLWLQREEAAGRIKVVAFDLHQSSQCITVISNYVELKHILQIIQHSGAAMVTLQLEKTTDGLDHYQLQITRAADAD